MSVELVRIGDLVLVPSIDFGRHCLRCGAGVHPPDPPHLCPDIVRGLREQADRDWFAYSREIAVLGGEA